MSLNENFYSSVKPKTCKLGDGREVNRSQHLMLGTGKRLECSAISNHEQTGAVGGRKEDAEAQQKHNQRRLENKAMKIEIKNPCPNMFANILDVMF